MESGTHGAGILALPGTGSARHCQVLFNAVNYSTFHFFIRQLFPELHAGCWGYQGEREGTGPTLQGFYSGGPQGTSYTRYCTQ